MGQRRHLRGQRWATRLLDNRLRILELDGRVCLGGKGVVEVLGVLLVELVLLDGVELLVEEMLVLLADWVEGLGGREVGRLLATSVLNLDLNLLGQLLLGFGRLDVDSGRFGPRLLNDPVGLFYNLGQPLRTARDGACSVLLLLRRGLLVVLVERGQGAFGFDFGFYVFLALVVVRDDGRAVQVASQRSQLPVSVVSLHVLHPQQGYLQLLVLLSQLLLSLFQLLI